MPTTEEKYQQELDQSSKDHHTPTAGAMTGHITVNLLVHILKVTQAKWFITGETTIFLAQNADIWIEKEYEFFDSINKLLVSEGEAIPTTTQQIREYTILEENGAAKYEEGKKQLFNLIKDFDTQLLFITRAIKLAKQEEKVALVSRLCELYGWMKEQIFKGQHFLGHELTEGLNTEEDKE
ncbi:MAG: DNA-binding protein [Liquorilactobacillus hordei]|uniref:DNA-binding protein n=1 Tax=Liquorilactobacillus hordei TaxID=468911 RepID=UPI0039EAED72